MPHKREDIYFFFLLLPRGSPWSHCVFPSPLFHKTTILRAMTVPSLSWKGIITSWYRKSLVMNISNFIQQPIHLKVFLIWGTRKIRSKQRDVKLSKVANNSPVREHHDDQQDSCINQHPPNREIVGDEDCTHHEEATSQKNALHVAAPKYWKYHQTSLHFKSCRSSSPCPSSWRSLRPAFVLIPLIAMAFQIGCQFEDAPQPLTPGMIPQNQHRVLGRFAKGCNLWRNGFHCCCWSVWAGYVVKFD